MRSNPYLIEPLEHRIAPAVVIAPGGKSATYNDLDGDRVTITVSKGQLDMTDFTTKAGFIGDQLQRLNFSDDGGEFDDANVSITAAPQLGLGNGFVDIGWIDSTGHPLGKVVVDGDLAKITAGAGTGVALKSLSARSLGVRGTDTGAPDTASTLAGNAASIRILGDVFDAKLTVNGNAGTTDIRGSVIGGGATTGLSISGDAAVVKIGGSVVGGAGPFSGVASVAGKLGTMSIRGSVIGGGGATSGSVLIGDAASLRIFGAVRGGEGVNSAVVQIGVGATTIDGPVEGGIGNGSATVLVLPDNATLPTKLALKGGLIGRAGEESGVVEWRASRGSIAVGVGGIHGGAGKLSGAIFTEADPEAATKTIDAVSVRGDVAGGDGELSGSVSAREIHALKITGSIAGGDGDTSGHVRIITGKTSSFTVGGDLRGGEGNSSGTARTGAGGNAGVFGATIKIGGSIIGGSGNSSGGASLSLSEPVSISVGGSIVGGSGQASGVLGSSGAPLVSIGGSVLGGSANDTGVVNLVGPGTVRIAGSVIGGDLAAGAGADLDRTGVLNFSFVNKLIIGGSVQAGTDASGTMDLTRSGFIGSNFVGSIAIGGSLLGSSTDRVQIVIGPGFTPGNTVLAKLTVGSNVSRADIFVGYQADLTPLGADQKVGAIAIGGDWIASNLAVGTTAGGDNAFGTVDDMLIAGGDAAIVASVASIVIKGQALGDGAASTAKFGFSAEQFGSVSIGGIALALTVGADTKPLGSTGDLSLRDLA